MNCFLASQFTGFFTRHHDHYTKSPAFFLGPLLSIAAGLPVGLVVIAIIRRNNKSTILFWSALTAAMLFCMAMGSYQYYDWYYSRYLLNIEANEDFMNNTASYPRQEQLAFDLLNKSYQDPNDFRLVQSSTTRADTVINKIKIDDYIIEFIYAKKKFRDKLFKSSYHIIGDKTYSTYIDMPLKHPEQFQIDSLMQSSML